MFDKLIKIMALIGAASLIALLIGAASITLINNSTNIDGDLSVSGNITIDGISYAHVPRNTIVAYYGTTAPQGWAICNGSNGTPDLRDRFIVSTGSSYGLGSTGGENSHTLTINEMPNHTHSQPDNSYLIRQSTGGGNTTEGADSTTGEPMILDDWNRSIGYSGGGAAHENRPPYYALTYIMKL